MLSYKGNSTTGSETTYSCLRSINYSDNCKTGDWWMQNAQELSERAVDVGYK